MTKYLKINSKLVSSVNDDLIATWNTEEIFPTPQSSGGYDFANDTWATIASQIKAGTDHYSLGDEKTDTITIGGTSYQATFKIVDSKVGRYATQSGSSHKVIELQTIFGDTATTGVSWNSTNTSFNNSNLKSWLNSDGLSCLPSALQSVLETTTVYSGNGSAKASASNIVASTGKIFTPCDYEYYGSDYHYGTVYETLNNGVEYGQYELYTTASKVKKMANNTASNYWTRSPYDTSYINCVDNTGSRLHYTMTNTTVKACLCFAW